MKNIENLPEIIFDLFSKKRFEDLDQSERQLVLQYMDEDDYIGFADVVQGFRQSDKKPITDITKQNAQQPIISRMLNYRMPMYQVAAAIVICVLATSVLTGHDDALRPSKEINAVGVSLADDDYPEDLIFDL